MIKYKEVKTINVNDWDRLVESTYGKVYSLQQQDGCRDRGIINISIPDQSNDEEMNDTIPEVINNEDMMGVKFDVWLKRDPNAPLNPTDEQLKNCNYFWGEDRDTWVQNKSHISMFWERNFYPELQAVANDLHTKGLIKSGTYAINIDW